jgi:hypothetical protein
MLDLIGLGLEILEDSRLLNDIVGKLIPLHIAIAININLIKQVSQVPHQGNFPIGHPNLPKLQMFLRDDDKLLEVEGVLF